MIFEVKSIDERGFEATLYKRSSFLEALHDVFSLSGRVCAIDVYKEENLTREKVIRVIVY